MALLLSVLALAASLYALAGLNRLQKRIADLESPDAAAARRAGGGGEE